MTTATETLPYRPDVLAQDLANAHVFFRRSTRVLGEAHADFAPREGMLTVKEHVAHVAHTVDWFLDALETGAYDMDFASHIGQYRKLPSLAAAFDWVDRAFARGADFLAAATAEQLAELQPANPIMNSPKGSVFGAMIEHTAHHRGTLTVYSRLQGLVPPMPYMADGDGAPG